MQFYIELSLITLIARDIDITILSVCPFVRYIPVFYENGLTYCNSFFTTQ